MKLSKWQLVIGATLVGVSIALYAIHCIIFADHHHILLWSLTSVAFLLISVLFVSLIIGRLLTHRDRRAKMEKMNRVIGAFFTEVGNDLLRMLFSWDKDASTRENLLGSMATWESQDFPAASQRLPRNPRTISYTDRNVKGA